VGITRAAIEISQRSAIVTGDHKLTYRMAAGTPPGRFRVSVDVLGRSEL